MEHIVPIVVSLVVTGLVWKYSGKSRSINLLLLGLLAMTALLSACNGTVQTIEEVSVTISGLIPMAASLVSTILPSESAAINSAVPLVQNGLQELSTVVKDYQGKPSDTTLAKVTAAFTDVEQNLTGLEAAAKVSDPASQKKLTLVVSSAQAVLATLEANIQGKHPATVSSTTAS